MYKNSIIVTPTHIPIDLFSNRLLVGLQIPDNLRLRSEYRRNAVHMVRPVEKTGQDRQWRRSIVRMIANQHRHNLYYQAEIARLFHRGIVKRFAGLLGRHDGFVFLPIRELDRQPLTLIRFDPHLDVSQCLLRQSLGLSRSGRPSPAL